jgi:hypothetical protein
MLTAIDEAKASNYDKSKASDDLSKEEQARLQEARAQDAERAK